MLLVVGLVFGSWRLLSGHCWLACLIDGWSVGRLSWNNGWSVFVAARVVGVPVLYEDLSEGKVIYHLTFVYYTWRVSPRRWATPNHDWRNGARMVERAASRSHKNKPYLERGSLLYFSLPDFAAQVGLGPIDSKWD